jgi:hypothetical protein
VNIDKEMEEEPDRLARSVFWIVHGDYRLEHMGAFQHHPPTGNAMSTPRTEIYRIVNRRISGHCGRDSAARSLGMGMARTHN